MASSIDSSGISFTALYTGEVWRRHRLSADFLASSRGPLLYWGARPLELVAERLLGANNEILLLQRHRIIDHLLTQAITEQGFSQVVELACGLSPRGHRFSQRFGSALHYIETDLAPMAARKEQLLREAGALSATHRVLPCNILEQGGADSLERLFREQLDPARKTVVITEGLINYFDYATIHGFWTRLASCLKTMPGGLYLSDLYPNLQGHKLATLANAFRMGLAGLTRSSVTLHFRSEAEMARGFAEAGFMHCQVHKPEQYYGQLEIPVQETPSFVRVLALGSH